MPDVKDFGHDPLPGSGKYEVREPGQGRTPGRLLGIVTARNMDQAADKAWRIVPEGTVFIVTEIPLGQE